VRLFLKGGGGLLFCGGDVRCRLGGWVCLGREMSYLPDSMFEVLGDARWGGGERVGG